MVEIKKKFRPCVICVSPYKTEIDALMRAGVTNPRIAEKYISKFLNNKSAATLVVQMRRHNKHLDQSRRVAVLMMPEPGVHPILPRASMEQFAQKLLEIGTKALLNLETNPDKVQMKDVIAAQRMLIEKQKLSIHEDALKLTMARFFGGFKPPPTLEGEVVNGESNPQIPSVLTGIVQPEDKK